MNESSAERVAVSKYSAQVIRSIRLFGSTQTSANPDTMNQHSRVCQSAIWTSPRISAACQSQSRFRWTSDHQNIEGSTFTELLQFLFASPPRVPGILSSQRWATPRATTWRIRILVWHSYGRWQTGYLCAKAILSKPTNRLKAYVRQHWMSGLKSATEIMN